MTPLPDIAEILLLPALLVATLAVASTLRDLSVHVADRGEPASIDAPRLALIVREASARTLLTFVSWLPISDAHPVRREGIEPRSPVLLVPGYGRGAGACLFIRIFLNHRGFAWVWAIPHPKGQSLAERAQALAEKVAELKRASGSPQVDIVAHGVGGLVAGWYISHQHGGDSVRRLVTLGTPWRGTRSAVFWRDAVAHECLYQSSVLDELQPPPIPTTAVWSERDPSVTPSSSALPTGADSVHIDAVGHDDQLVNARAYRAVQFALLRPSSTS